MELNDVQRQAVEHPGGPLLVLAGAGSGKTRVLTGRIAHLVTERGVPAWGILAFTFTNKAAREMKERALHLLGTDEGDLGVWLGTFHGTCVRILRRHAELLGFPKSFVIYDTDDQRSLLRELLRDVGADDRRLTPAGAGSRISRLKNEGTAPDVFAAEASGPLDRQVAEVYAKYEKALRDRAAMDFDDLLLYTVRLFDLDPGVHRQYADRFRHVLVDEYQDTNSIQFELIERLSRTHRNLLVVGDDDQSIYGWRGADVGNILSFEDRFPDATVLRLTQNYRSTRTILRAANHVVKNNAARKEKELWTENAAGEPLGLHLLPDEESEGERVVSLLLEQQRLHARANRDFAVLYRTNAQSRAVENALRRSAIPYQLTGGVSFYERREVKDLLAYLRALTQPRDTVAWYRILNVPGRGIGKTTLDRLREFADAEGITTPEALRHPRLADAVGGAASKKLVEVSRLFEGLAPLLSLPPAACLSELVAKIRFREYLLQDDPAEAAERIENVEELITGADAYARRTDEPTVDGFLAEVALLTDVDLWEEGEDTVNLMTIHAAKGLEFPVVFVVGMEEGLLPHASSLDHPKELEEERRLFYVALTRARERVFLLQASFRRAWNASGGGASRFLTEIPADCLQVEEADAYAGYGSYGRASKPSRPASGPRLVRDEEPSPVKSPVGAWVTHPQFGEGQVVACEGRGDRAKLTVQFRRAGTKKILAAFAEWSYAD
ncbi:MAG TPA: UvrD-helicase domain-containing protein [Candidatus Eisenbacteria bacterium]|nr:UvrD-helicase domain-containing protein [Candidatus Eisenbacteria bacterium]